ncbi:hypothetical protein ACCUM_2313 [Candidatus Accumulibacter phosphatis]|uniref:Uncharacterized protein n=1 Tax=Candidatus Accumulibacter phosphatis TaxID=327160 RepID=A0A5S4EI72_9PROT|nr:hypothetical protein ACCUM_2266 [Candidatus Accumulibacter phosphatis]TMQ78098.1 hypothetical protein ACCUM_2313 [Candidatus Accumulibacter phosphatis]
MGTADGAGPDVGSVNTIWCVGLKERRGKWCFNPLAPDAGNTLKLAPNCQTKLDRPINSRPLNQACYWVQVVTERGQAKAGAFVRNTAAAGSRV